MLPFPTSPTSLSRKRLGWLFTIGHFPLIIRTDTLPQASGLRRGQVPLGRSHAVPRGGSNRIPEQRCGTLSGSGTGYAWQARRVEIHQFRPEQSPRDRLKLVSVKGPAL